MPKALWAAALVYFIDSVLWAPQGSSAPFVGKGPGRNVWTDLSMATLLTNVGLGFESRLEPISYKLNQIVDFEM